MIFTAVSQAKKNGEKRSEVSGALIAKSGFTDIHGPQRINPNNCGSPDFSSGATLRFMFLNEL